MCVCVCVSMANFEGAATEHDSKVTRKAQIAADPRMQINHILQARKLFLL